MSESKFTPGPWTDYGYPTGDIHGHCPDDGKYHQPIIECDSGQYGPYGADRALVLAAPEMYEKIEAALKEWDILPRSRAFTIAEITDWLSRFMGPAMDDLRAVLTKADGIS